MLYEAFEFHLTICQFRIGFREIVLKFFQQAQIFRQVDALVVQLEEHIDLA